MVKLTILGQVLLVALASSNFVLQRFGLFEFLLKSNDPSVTLFGASSLEAVDVIANLDGEAIEAFLGDIGSLVL